MLRYAIGLVALLTVFSSCDSDFSLTGDYQEKALIYGLLDPNDNPNAGGNGHVFRIQKAFLGEESAFLMAANPDSSYFRYEDLKVELVEYLENGTESDRWELDTIYITNKDTGNPDDEVIDFFGPSQRLYKTATTGADRVNIDPEMTYEIVLTKRSNDSIIASATTTIVDASTFKWNAPNENSPATPGTTRKMDLYSTLGEYKDYTIRFDVAQRAIQYELWLRFYYREVIQGVETLKTVEWRATTFELDPNVTDWQVQLSSQSIYNRLATSVQPNPDAVRYIGVPPNYVAQGYTDPFPTDNNKHDFDLFFRVAGEELFQYIDINQPSNSGALTDKPVYTNVDNGLGVFSTRTKVEFQGMFLSGTAADQLAGGELTQGLGFVND